MISAVKDSSFDSKFKALNCERRDFGLDELVIIVGSTGAALEQEAVSEPTGIVGGEEKDLLLLLLLLLSVALGKSALEGITNFVVVVVVVGIVAVVVGIVADGLDERELNV